MTPMRMWAGNIGKSRRCAPPSRRSPPSCCLRSSCCPAASARAADDPVRVGDVSTTFRLVGRNDQIVVDRYDDPKVSNVSCYMSRAETGGIKGSLGLATDPSRFSIACRAIGGVSVPDKLPANEVVFGASANWLFKEIRVSRMWTRRSACWSTWSGRPRALTPGGSPYNSISVVPVTP